MNEPSIIDELPALIDHVSALSINDESEASTKEDHEPIGCTSSESCSPCNYLHWFMLERLPTALKAVLEKIEHDDKEKAKSIKNALQFVEDSYQKMMLYQAHIVRVVNQQNALTRIQQTLQDLCEFERNQRAKRLYIIIDFKMKWEAMYQREKSTDHYGKRGISWHGCRIEFYLWNEVKGKAESHVVKVDQILAGANKQDGMTVLALLEALQAYCAVEFPGAEITFLQSDNASNYQSKHVVCGIPILNDVSLS
jgi:hypothetical protein